MIRRIIPILLATLVVFFPLFTLRAEESITVTGEGTLIPCGQNGDTCTFTDFAELIQRIISFLAFYIAAPLATLAIMYAGFKYLTSMDKPGPREEAKKILWDVLWGFIFVLGAWLIIDTILDVLLTDNPLNS